MTTCASRSGITSSSRRRRSTPTSRSRVSPPQHRPHMRFVSLGKRAWMPNSWIVKELPHSVLACQNSRKMQSRGNSNRCAAELYEGCTDVLEFFWKNSRSVEIVKDGELQKMFFRIKDEVRALIHSPVQSLVRHTDIHSVTHLSVCSLTHSNRSFH